MAKLTMGTESALNLQRKIQTELAVRGYSSESDPVMAEYITIMVINDKTAEQINAELADLIGSDYEPNFTDWLFLETAKAASAKPDQPPPSPTADVENRQEEAPPATTGSARRGSGGAGLLQSALSGVRPPTGPSAASRHNVSQPSSGAQKRTASARSPSPSSSSGPNKVRRTDTPTGPRAMTGTGNAAAQGGRSLIDRVSGHARRGGMGGVHGNLSPAQVSHIQSKIDGITGHQMSPPMIGPGFMPMNGSPPMNFSLQDMMMMNWDMMRQMANTMGMLAPNMGGPIPPPVGGFGFPQPGMVPPQMANFIGAPPFVPEQQGGRGIGGGRGGGPNRGGLVGGRGRGNGTNGHSNSHPLVSQPEPAPTPAIAPVPVPGTEAQSLSTTVGVPTRPGTPSLCKYALKCTNPQCRFSHPSPVATVESGVVLSTEFCPKGKDCKDKDCTFGHVSPSVASGSVQKAAPVNPPVVVPVSAASQTPCKFGLACTRPGCIFTHPPNFRPPHSSSQPAQAASNAIPCRFGTSCTRADCPFQHPKGHVPANMFYRGLGSDAPLVEGYISPHKSVRFGSDPKAAAPPSSAANQEKKEEKQDEKGPEAVALGKDNVEKAVDVGA